MSLPRYPKQKLNYFQQYFWNPIKSKLLTALHSDHKPSHFITWLNKKPFSNTFHQYIVRPKNIYVPSPNWRKPFFHSFCHSPQYTTANPIISKVFVAGLLPYCSVDILGVPEISRESGHWASFYLNISHGLRSGIRNYEKMWERLFDTFGSGFREWFPLKICF